MKKVVFMYLQIYVCVSYWWKMRPWIWKKKEQGVGLWEGWEGGKGGGNDVIVL